MLKDNQLVLISDDGTSLLKRTEEGFWRFGIPVFIPIAKRAIPSGMKTSQANTGIGVECAHKNQIISKQNIVLFQMQVYVPGPFDIDPSVTIMLM